MAVRHDAKPQALQHARQRQPSVKGGKGSGLTPRIRAAITFFVFGWEDMTSETKITYATAAERAGIKERALRDALKKPAPLAYYHAEVAQFRVGERPANLRRLKGFRDDPEMGKSPAGVRAVADVVRTMETDPDARNGTTVNVGVSVNNSTTVKPGYVIDLRRNKDAPGVQSSGGSSAGYMLVDADDEPDACKVIEHEPAAIGTTDTQQDRRDTGEAGGTPFNAREVRR